MEKSIVFNAITSDKVCGNGDLCYNFNYGGPKGDAKTDYAEIWIKHEGVEKLEANIENKADECITAYVHFLAGTNTLHDLCLQVHDMEIGEDYPLDTDILTDEERDVITNCAIAQINANRQ